VKVLPRLLYLSCFIGLAAVAVLAFNRIVSPSIAPILVWTLLVAASCAAPGLVHRKLWPLSIVLLPVGCYLLMRTASTLPAGVEGIGEQLRFYIERLQMGASSYKAAVYPLPLTSDPQLQLFLVFSIYWLVGAAALVALDLRKPLPALILLLVLLGYSLTVDASSRAVWPALLFAILATCLLVLCRGLTREGWRIRDAAAGAAVGIVGSFLAFALLLAAPSVAATPWQNWRSWDPFGTGGSLYSINWLQSYPTLLDPGENRPIMWVQSPLPCYWRALSWDTFTGTAWLTSQAFMLRVDSREEADGVYTFSLPKTELLPEGETVTEAFQILESVRTNYFFAGGDPQSLTLEEDIAVRMNSMRALRVSDALGPGLRYSLTAVIPELRPSDLVGLGSEYPEELDHYLALPFAQLSDLSRHTSHTDTESYGADLDGVWRQMISERGPDGWEWAGLFSLNDRVIGEATDPYQVTLRIERYLRRFYTYTLAPPASEYSSPYAAFLFDTRSGYCQHFAGAMALLLRFNNIPARVAVGFTAGERDAAGAYLVSTNNAHAWVEAFFPGIGWVAFDPTPGRNIPTPGASSTTPGFVYPFTGTGGTSWAETDDTTSPGDTSRTEQTGEDSTSTGERDGPGIAAWLPWVAAAAAVLIGWPVGRGFWRRRGLHRGPPQKRLRASLGLLRAELTDYEIPVTSAHTLEEALEIVRTRVGLEPDCLLVDRANAILFGGRKATADDVRRADVLRREVATRLRKQRGLVRTWSAWYGVSRLSLGRGRRA
jgi:transglutaminase-like putative cysteine protease